MQTTKKEFSIMKWLVIPLLLTVLGYVIIDFNNAVFPDDSIIYQAVVLFLIATSLTAGFYISSSNQRVAKSMFVCECILILIMACSAVYCLRVKREMAMAREAGVQSTAIYESISRLKSGKAQERAIGKTDKIKSAQTTFEEKERILFFLMFSEFAFSAFTLMLLVAMTTFHGSAQLRDGDYAFYDAEAEVIENELDVSDTKQQTRLKLENKGKNDHVYLYPQKSGVRVVAKGGKYLGHIANSKLPPFPKYEEIKKLL